MHSLQLDGHSGVMALENGAIIDSMWLSNRQE